MQEDGGRLVEIRLFEDPMQADLVRSMLEAHGVDATVRDDRLSFSVLGGRRAGVRLSVRPEDADRARWLMMHGIYADGEEPDWEESPAEEPDTGVYDAHADATPFAGENAAGAEFTAAAPEETPEEPALCPNCGGADILLIQPSRLLWLVSSLLLLAFPCC